MNKLNGKSTSSAQIDAFLKLIAGVNKHFSKVPTLTLASQSVTPAQLVATLQAGIDALRLVETKRGEWHDAVQQLTASRGSTKALLLALNQMLLAMFKDAQTLSDFGIVPRKRQTPNAATKAAAALKSKATRKARGTLGSRAKLQVHGSTDTTVSSDTAKVNGAVSTSSSSSLSKS